jgi:hypothetical protein
MKKIILFAAITIFGITASNAQGKKAPVKKETPVKAETTKVDGAGIVFENETGANKKYKWKHLAVRK